MSISDAPRANATAGAIPRPYRGRVPEIAPDASVAERAMVAAGAVVPPDKRGPSGELWAGNPARRLREVRPEESEFILWDARHDAGLAREYRDGA